MPHTTHNHHEASTESEPSQERPDLVQAAEIALSGYAKDGGSWQSAKNVFTEQLEHGARLDEALYKALYDARNGAEQPAAEAIKRFWSALPVERAAETALSGYAKDGGSWQSAKNVFTEQLEHDTLVEDALQHALADAEDGAVSSPDEARRRFWQTLQPDYVDVSEQLEQYQVNDGTRLTKLLHKPSGKGVAAATFEGERAGHPVIVKHGNVSDLTTEASILSKVSHPGLPKIASFSEAVPALNNIARLTMEKLPGVSLDKMIGMNSQWEHPPLDERSAIKITRGLARCYEALSKAGYLYRDLNLGHVIVDTDGTDFKVGLVDVESSAIKNPSTGVAQLNGPRGTWETMSPEEFDSNGSMTEASSVYSLGVMLSQLLSGRSPYKLPDGLPFDVDGKKTIVKTMHEQKLTEFPSDREDITVVLKKALQPDPKQRFQTITEFLDALPKR